MSTETPWPTPQPPAAEEAAPQARRWAKASGDLGAFAVIALLDAVCALAVGAIWRGAAPAVRAVVDKSAAYYAAPEGKTFVGRDGWFALLACCAGVLLALVAFIRYRRGPSTGAAVALAAGGIGGAYLAAWFGGYLGPGHGSIPRAAHGLADGTAFDLPVQLRATGVIWLWPAVAVGLFFFLMLVFGPVDDEPEQLYPAWDDAPPPPRPFADPELYQPPRRPDQSPDAPAAPPPSA
jgi:hypothetical protein